MKRDLASGFALTLPKEPRRTMVADTAAKRFAASDDAKPARPSRMRRPTLGERMAIYLPPELAEELRIRCAKERRSLSDAITHAVEEWVRRPAGP